MAFILHPKLRADCIDIGELPLCQLVLMNNRHFPWVILVPRREAARELFDLAPAEQMQLMLETNQVARDVQSLTGADKMNVAALGNQVEQLHVHVIARFKSDAAWPHPVWNCRVEPTPYSAVEKSEVIKRLQLLINITKM